jgi:protein-arginine kinase activator protein McsA
MFLFPTIRQTCDECGEVKVCSTVKDDTGEFPVCAQCRTTHRDYYAGTALAARIASRKPVAMMA